LLTGLITRFGEGNYQVKWVTPTIILKRIPEVTSKILPSLVLFLSAPIIVELLSGSAPPAEFFHPVSFWILSILYGGGAILICELKIRWQQGWLSLLVLGATYAIIEEGLMVKSFFDPTWVDLGASSVATGAD